MGLLRPVHCCMYQHGSGELNCCPNGSLSDAVLMMGSYTTEYQGLVAAFKLFCENVRDEDTVVAMILFYVNAALAGFVLP